MGGDKHKFKHQNEILMLEYVKGNLITYFWSIFKEYLKMNINSQQRKALLGFLRRLKLAHFHH